MRVAKIGSVKGKRAIFGIKLVAIYIWNPFKRWFSWRKEGLVRFFRLPGIRFIILKKKGE